MNTLSVLMMMVVTVLAPRWTVQTSGVTARLRGISAVNERVAWASGASSTVLRTTDGGATWKKLTVIGDTLDFRDIDAVDAQTAYALSIGNGPASRIYKTTDAGATWTMQFKSDDQKVFLDAMSFWDANNGIVFGDSVAGQLYILLTDNGGRTWTRVPPASLPPALEGEGAFAASGTNIAVVGKTHAWIGTGAGAKARVLRTSDRGRSWQVADTPLAAAQSAGIFSIAFRDEKHGIVVGGDYRKEQEAVDNLAITDDGGVTWKLVKGLSGYRSVVAYVPGTDKPALVALGPSGGDYSLDDGQTWSRIEGPGFDTFSFVPRKSTGWAAGANGALGKLVF
ncbi:MAG TPA: YCF48-related protein [Pyrinomonadaceae bacterium]|nr:YCF48-related protein [Pyrinomonadaceae bacterium]